jgi:uncharacterized membrane protein
LRGFSPRLVVVSLVFLAFIVLVPFSTRGFGTTNSSSEVTTVVYAINVALVSAMATVLPWFARADNLFLVMPSVAELRARTVDRLLPTVVFLASIPIALFGAPSAARYFWLVLLPLGYFGGKWSTQRIGALQEADDLRA